MDEESKKNWKVTRRDIEVKPAFLETKAQEVPVVAADYFRLMLDTDMGLVTLLFYRRHVIPKTTGKEVVVDTIADELFLEIKVPLNTFFAAIIFAYDLLKEIREEARGRKPSRIYIGPVTVKEFSRHEER